MKLEKIRERWSDWKARMGCRLTEHSWETMHRLRLVRLTDDPWLEFIDGLPAGKPLSCKKCGIDGVKTEEGVVVWERS